MAEKRNALVKTNQDLEDASKKLETAKEVTEIVQYVPLSWYTPQHVKLKCPREKQSFCISFRWSEFLSWKFKTVITKPIRRDSKKRLTYNK